MTKIEREIGQLSLEPDLARTVLQGEVLVRDSTNPYKGALAVVDGERGFGIFDELPGGTAGQALPARVIRMGQTRVRIQDNATVTIGHPLAPSGSDSGSLSPNVRFGEYCAVALESIASGTTSQYIQAEVDCISGAPFARYSLYMRLADISTASSVISPPSPYNGRFLGATAVIENGFTGSDAVITFEIGAISKTAVTGGDITLSSPGSAEGTIGISTAVTANDTIGISQIIKATSNGASTGVTPAQLTCDFIQIL